MITAWRSSRFLPNTRTWSSWIWACTLSFVSLMQAHDLLRLLHRDALLDLDPLPHGAARGGLDLPVGERLRAAPPAVELRLEDVEDLLQGVVVVRVDGDPVLLQPELRLGLLEVVARLDLAGRLVHRVGDRLRVDLARDVEGVLSPWPSVGRLRVSAGRPRRPVGARRRTARRTARSSPPCRRSARSRCSPSSSWTTAWRTSHVLGIDRGDQARHQGLRPLRRQVQDDEALGVGRLGRVEERARRNAPAPARAPGGSSRRVRRGPPGPRSRSPA